MGEEGAMLEFLVPGESARGGVGCEVVSFWGVEACLVSDGRCSRGKERRGRS